MQSSVTHICDGCGGKDGEGLHCSRCRFGAHLRCINFQDIINYPCHTRHPLKIVPAETIDYGDGRCHFCREILDGPTYHCSICNFSIDWSCWRNPPPLTIYQPKSHNHTFTLMATKVSFTCNACGMVGDRNPYVCLECNFLLHQDCINLARVIEINRHDHRISRNYQLDHNDWECGVCRKQMAWTFGAFSCWRCPNYGVHSKCATRKDVWNGQELEDEPDIEEIEAPYEVINENEINHFSHRIDNLILGVENDPDCEKMRCRACILPINSDPFFKCVDFECCEFVLHKVCANLPRVKRNILHNHKLTLEPDSLSINNLKCRCCLQVFDGFRYICKSACAFDDFYFDLRCGTIAEPFHHELHPHPLYRTSDEHKTCGACGEDAEYVLNCIVCDFALSIKCATLPRKVKHRCDDHALTLHHGAGNSNGQLWCDICEGKTDTSVWFYGCDDCGTTLHIKCVLGDMYYLKLGYEYQGGKLVSNNGMTRPFCIVCEKRGMFPSFLKATSELDSTIIYACSIFCANFDKWLLEVNV